MGSRGIKNYFLEKIKISAFISLAVQVSRLETESPNAELRKERVNEGNTKPTHFQSLLIRCYPLLN